MSRPHHKNGRKPIAEVSSGSVTIPIYASPVTIKIGKKPSPNSEADSKLNGDASERKTYTSFKVVYYEGTQRVFRRRNTLARAKELATEMARQLASDGVRSQYPDIWCEIPPNGKTCPHTGLKHAKLYSLFAKGGLARPHVRVASLRNPGAKQDKTIFHLGDFLRFLGALAAHQGSGELRKNRDDISSEPI